jgi:hypothetical protein
MFGKTNAKGKQGDYSKISLDEFSDDDSDHADLTPPSRHGSSNGGDYPSQSVGRQQEMLRKQDQGLEMLSQSADRLGIMSLQINDEIGFQNKMLDDMEQDLDEADENLNIVTRSTKDFIERAGGTKNCIIIVVLAVVVLVLLIILIYFP